MIVITGASSGLGAALAQHYAEQGRRLFLTGRSSGRLAKLAASLPSQVHWLALDLTLEEQVESLFNQVGEVPSMIIHCAGSGLFGPVVDHSEAQLKQLLDNNVVSAGLMLKHTIARYRTMPLQLAMVVSTAAQVGKANEVFYCGAKWAVRGMVEAARAEIKTDPMRITGIYPGGMNTQFWQQSDCRGHVGAAGFMTAQEVARMIASGLEHSQVGYVSDLTINRG